MLRRKPTIYHPSDIIYSLIRLLPHLIKLSEVSTSSESFISPKEEYDGCSLDYEIKGVLDNYQTKIFIPVAGREGAYAVYNFNGNSFLLSAGIQKVLIGKNLKSCKSIIRNNLLGDGHIIILFPQMGGSKKIDIYVIKASSLDIFKQLGSTSGKVKQIIE